MSNKDWKQKRIDEINLEISKKKDHYSKQCTSQYYIDEYSDILNSNAENFEQFKKERGEIWATLNIIFQ